MSGWAAVAQAASDAIGGIVQNEYNQRAAEDQMLFQRKMSNTAHRREMEDLAKAGLNPLLTTKYGGASTPNGASWQSAPFNPGSGVSNALSAQAARANTAADTQVKLNQAPNVAADTAVKKSQERVNNAQASKTANEAELARKQVENFDSTQVAESLSRQGLNSKQIESINYSIQNMQAQFLQTLANTRSINADNVYREIKAQLERDHPELVKVDVVSKNRLIDRVMDGLGFLRGQPKKEINIYDNSSTRNQTFNPSGN